MPSAISNLIKSQPIHFHAIEDHHLQDAPCLSEINFDEIIHYLQENSETLKDSINDLMNESRSRVTANIKQVERPDFSQVHECKNEICAVQKVLGEKKGPMLLYLHHRYNINSSHLTNVFADPLGEQELSQIIHAVKDFPEKYFQNLQDYKIIRFRQGRVRSGLSAHTRASESKGSIELFDPWTELSEFSMRTSLSHELAHLLARHILIEDQAIDTSNQWLNLSGWKKIKDEFDELVWKPSAKTQFVSKYAKENPQEDFAESLIAFRYRPSFLKKIHPEKYYFLKEYIFNNQEVCL